MFIIECVHVVLVVHIYLELIQAYYSLRKEQEKVENEKSYARMSRNMKLANCLQGACMWKTKYMGMYSVQELSRRDYDSA